MNKKYLSIVIVGLLIITNIPTAISFSSKSSIDVPITTTSTIDYFNWKDYQGKDWTTPSKDQMKSGPCWAFAAIGILESVIKIRENYADFNPDLSEQYILSCLPYAGSMQGGSSYLALQYMMETTAKGNNQNGAIPEWCFPYQETDAIPCSAKDGRWNEQLIPISAIGQWTSQGTGIDRQKIKDDIVEKGPVVATITIAENLRSWGFEHTSPNDYFPDPGPVSSTNHVVVLVGWKDDSSIPNGGYWICKNSWEPYWGYDGFFNIEYGALKIDEGGIIWVDYNPTHNLAPVAKIKETMVGSVRNDITFDASESFDTDGEIAQYAWDFGDGSQGTGKTVSNQYSEKGMYTVTLTVTDNDGKQSYDEKAALIDFWTKGDSWTYNIDEINIKQDNLGFHIEFDASIPDFQLTVSEITEEQYILDLKGSLDGEVTIDIAGFPISAKFSRLTKITGNFILEKSDLSIQDVTLNIKGLIKMSIAEIPFKIPVPFEINLEPELDGGLTFINFPLNTNNCWSTGDTTISIDGTISSFYLKVIKMANAIAKLFGKEFLPPEYKQLLPDIDISKWLEIEEISNSFEIISHPRAFICTEIEEITVPAGTFESYEVTFDHEMAGESNFDVVFNYHFALEVAMIADASLTVGDFLSIHAELIKTAID